MTSFLTRFASLVTGALSGFDRLCLCGSLQRLSYCLGLQNYLWAQRVPFKDFAAHSAKVSAQIEEASLRLAQQQGREIRYLNSASHRKEDVAREIAARDRIKTGLICVLRSVDPCMSFDIRKNAQTRKLQIHYRQRKCIHLYHYQIHPIFGFMHARIQTWFPFRVYVCINGREWLARQMDDAGLKYVRRNNTFTWVEDVAAAQALLDQQRYAPWPSLLGGLTAALNPIHHELFANFVCHYYWSVEDSEWASDVMFRDRADLEAIYPRLLRYALSSFGAVDVLRFLAKPVGASGKVPYHCRHEVSTNLKERLNGLRLRHWLGYNSIKLYDKCSVLRAETLIHDPGQFQVLRPSTTNPEGPATWRPLRKGIVDLPQRAEVGQAANDRYFNALAAVHDETPVRQWLDPLCCPAPAAARQPQPAPTAPPVTAADAASLAPPAAPQAASVSPSAAPLGGGTAPRPGGRRVRALNPLADDDARLLTAVGRHEFLINGLRNRDLRPWLYGQSGAVSAGEQRKRSAAVTRKLRLLRAHGLLEKVAHSHRYLVSAAGRQAITALLAVRNASTEQLTKLLV